MAAGVALGMALIPLRSWSGAEVEQAFGRARELCSQIGESPLLFGALWGLSTFYLVRGDYKTGCQTAEQCVALAEATQDPDMLVEAYWVLGVPLFWLGELTSAREYFEKCLAVYDAARHGSHVFLYGQDPGVAGELYLAVTLVDLGYPDQALAVSEESLAHAERLSHPFSIGWGQQAVSMTFAFRREWQRLQAAAETQVAFSTEQGFPFGVAWGHAFLGLALAHQGRGAEGVERLAHAIAAMRAMGAGIVGVLLLAWIAEVYGLVGRVQEGLDALAEALSVVDKSAESHWSSEIFRLNGGLLLNQSVPDDENAERCLAQAVKIAQDQKAKLLELRAATSLGRLWQRQGKCPEARQLLSGIYGWFSEGFDTPDLKDAKALLDELA